MNITVDHKDLNKSNNQKYNLRTCSMQENSFNRNIYSNNVSGTTGVYWNNHKNKWVAQIRVNYKQKYLGSYDNINDAIKARKEAEEQYFGEFSFDNTQKHLKKCSL